MPEFDVLHDLKGYGSYVIFRDDPTGPWLVHTGPWTEAEAYRLMRDLQSIEPERVDNDGCSI